MPRIEERHACPGDVAGIAGNQMSPRLIAVALGQQPSRA
jgi:hypothetical protein